MGGDGLRAVRLIISGPPTKRKMGRHRGHPSLEMHKFFGDLLDEARALRQRKQSPVFGISYT
jgi:hypothetical protein